MHQKLPLLNWLSVLVFFMILSGQSVKVDSLLPKGFPLELAVKLDSFKKADDLRSWLYSCREYVYKDPAKLIALLTEAQSLAWRPCNKDREREEWFNCLAARGYYSLYNGDILRSIDIYEQAFRFYFDKPVPGSDVVEYVLKPLGNNYTRLGDYDRAFYIQEKCLQLVQQKDSSQLASVFHNLATTAIWKEDFSLARLYCEKGLRCIKNHSPLQGLLLSTLGEVYLKLGKADSAKSMVTRAITILSACLDGSTEMNVPYWLLGAWQGMGDIELQRKEPEKARQAYAYAIQLNNQYYKGQRIRELSRLFVSLGNVFMQQKQATAALENYNRSISLLIPSFQSSSAYALPANKDLYGENTLLDALIGKARSLYALNKKDESLACYTLVYETDRKLRKAFFSVDAKQQQQRENRRWAESAIETSYELYRHTARKEYAAMALLFAEMSKAQMLLDEMINNLRYNRLKSNDTLLKRQDQLMQAITYSEREAALHFSNGNEDSALTSAKKELQFELSLIQKQVREKYPVQENYLSNPYLFSADSLLENIPEGTRVIEFFTGERNIYRIDAMKGSVLQIDKIENAQQVLQEAGQFVDSFFQQGPAKMMNRPHDFYFEAFHIYDKLCKDGIPNDTKECIMIPDGILGLIPFEALVTDSVEPVNTMQWPYLLEKTILHHCYSLQTVRQQQRPGRTGNSFAGYFVSFDSSSQAFLPAVKKEYEEIKNSVRGDFFLEKDASRVNFNSSLDKANVLHISTHSYLQGKDHIPVLQLAGDKFFLFELYGKTSMPQLVVLSACRTGHGMLAEGEGINSLARGFTATGASGIIAGLWDMNDEATAGLMGSFYRQLKLGDLPASALHEAKMKWLQKQDIQPFQKLPYYWAGLVYSGDNGPIQLQQRTGTMEYMWITVMAVLVLIILFYIIRSNPQRYRNGRV